jgi:hypothetical protein
MLARFTMAPLSKLNWGRPKRVVLGATGNSHFSAILLINSFEQLENHYLKNTDLIERSVIDEHSSVDGLKTHKILFRMVQK